MPRVRMFHAIVMGLCLVIACGILYSVVYGEEKVHLFTEHADEWNNNSLSKTIREFTRVGLQDHPPTKSKVETTHAASALTPNGNLTQLQSLPWLHREYNQSCSANNLVFLKTHKTGSTTLASIFERYGFYNNFTFALPPTRHFFEPVQDLFKRSNMALIDNQHMAAFKSDTWEGYNYLTNHARYNRPEMDSVVHDAIFVTILRSPVEQFESTFGYYELARYTGLANTKNPIEAFMKKPEYYFKKKFMAYYWSQNAQLYDLGVNHAEQHDSYTLNYKIRQLQYEFDLVLITEYFDESLLLLRKLMCWEWSDILYFPKGVRSRSHRVQMSQELKNKILAWNSADALLYDHFNQTLWRKIREYGPRFEEDLIFFRAKLKNLTATCIATNVTNGRDARETKPVLKTNATKLCHKVYQDDVMYTRMIRAKMTNDGLLAKPTKQTAKVVKLPVVKKNFLPSKWS